MASPTTSCPLHGLKLPISVLFIYFLSLLPSKSGGSAMRDTRVTTSKKEQMMVWGRETVGSEAKWLRRSIDSRS
ncbi:hypothetical protein Fmac_013789 [Flemingia macrophylla]|uniref:Uncharacterized protein n=1 Tax=Flemingia macrophylla TaxID=520843 RepID=A0ABD1MU45_9FABA